MKYGQITWSIEKNRILRATRGVGFEDVEAAIEQRNVLDDLPHHLEHKYPNQRLLIVRIEDYVFNVPYVMTENGVFLKTMFASRKSKKLYFDGQDND